MGEGTLAFPFRLRPILFLVAILYLNFLARIVFAPLLPVIKIEFGLGHGEAGSLFFFTASGYFAGLFGAAFVSSQLNHRRTILLSAGAVGGAMLAVSQTASIRGLYSGLSIVGISAGFYVPSALAVISELVNKEHWGKAIAIHEFAPNLGLITAPLLVESLLKLVSWRSILGIIGASSILTGVLFLLFAEGGSQKGETPNRKAMRRILANSSFWIMAAAFVLSLGAHLGVYAMLPLFLTTEMGFARGFANTLIGLSRFTGVMILFFSGLITDQIGRKQAVILFVATTGTLTLMLGTLRGPVVTPILIILQATSAVCFIPAGLATVSLLFPSSFISLAVSLLVPIGFLCGAGLIPAGIGYLADVLSFSFGFSLMGISALASLPLLFCLPSNTHSHSS